MEMRNGLAGVPAVVDDQPISTGFKAKEPGYLRCLEHQVTQHRLILSDGLTQPRNGTARHDQNMDRGLGANIVEGSDEVVLVYHSSWHLTGKDSLKQGLAHGSIQHKLQRTTNMQFAVHASRSRQVRRYSTM